MLQPRELDEHTTFFDQLGADVEGEIVLVNTFVVPAEDADELLAVWTEDAAFMTEQPGFVTAQLHRGIAGSGVFVNVAVWRSIADLRNAATNPDFMNTLQKYPDSAVAYGQVCQRVAVPGICPG